MAARGEDWPTFNHDSARSGVTAEKLALPLVEQWVFAPRFAPEPAWPGPKAAAVEGIKEEHRVSFDDAYHVVASGDSVYFCAFSENKVYVIGGKTLKHSTCPMPMAVLKGLEVAAGLALKRDVVVAFDK
jgi:hypothetical protein